MARPASADPTAGAEGAWRYERKFLVRELDPRLVEHAVRIHPAHFREIHHQRWINNIYFDSAPLQFLRDAVQGHSERLKVRIRWYGDLFGRVARPVLELKRKHALVGTKDNYPLPAFDFERAGMLPPLGAWFRDLPWPMELPGTLAGLRPALINRYSRRYFATPDGRFRLTIDRDIEYFSPAPGRLPARPHPRDGLITVVELKSAAQDELEADRITHRFPFLVTKNSKYVNGMMRVGRR